MTPIATQCVEDLVGRLQSVAGMADKSFFILTEAELFDRAKVMGNLPAAGVVYEGLHSKPEVGTTHKVGISGSLGCAIIVFYNSKIGIGQIGADSLKPKAIQLLDTIRGAIMDTRSPTGHHWQFMAELPAMEKNGVVVWMQRWQTPVRMFPQG